MQEMSGLRQQLLSILVEANLESKDSSNAYYWHNWNSFVLPPTSAKMMDAWATLVPMLAFGHGPQWASNRFIVCHGNLADSLMVFTNVWW